MESKTARLTVLVDPEKKKAFDRLCASQDLTPSQVVRQLIRNYLADHGVSYGLAAGGSVPPSAVRNPGVKASAPPEARAPRKAKPAGPSAAPHRPKT